MLHLAVCELKSPSMSDFLWGLENSGWLRHIKAIMDAGTFIAKVRDGRESKRRGRPASTPRCPAHGSGELLCTPPSLPAGEGLWREVSAQVVEGMSAQQSRGQRLTEYSLQLGMVLDGGNNSLHRQVRLSTSGMEARYRIMRLFGRCLLSARTALSSAPRRQ